MIFRAPPHCGQCSISMSKTRLSNRAQFMRAGAPCASSSAGSLCGGPGTTRGAQPGELAKEGMTGPSEAFEGRHGIWDQVTGRFELDPFGGNGRPFAVERSGIKYLPTEYNSQLPLYLILKLRENVTVDDIESVSVEVYRFTYTEIGSEPEKWRPTTRETADHSRPYMLAAALSDGDISIESFSEERIRDPQLPALMDRIKITEKPELTRKYPASMECRIEIETKKGGSLVEAGSYPKGHPKNPMTDAEVEQKFRKLCKGIVANDQCEAIVQAVWQFEGMRDVGELLKLIRVQDK